jgi:hypothetical protein
MSVTVKIGGAGFPLAGVPQSTGSVTNFEVVPSSTVTAEAVLAAAAEAESFVISTDGTDAPAWANVALGGNVAIDSSTGNIVFAMRQKSADEITREQMQAQIDALGAQVAALTLGV